MNSGKGVAGFPVGGVYVVGKSENDLVIFLDFRILAFVAFSSLGGSSSSLFMELNPWRPDESEVMDGCARRRFLKGTALRKQVRTIYRYKTAINRILQLIRL